MEIINNIAAPQAIGAYSQAVKVDNIIYISGQLGLDPTSMQLKADFSSQVEQAFKNLLVIANNAKIVKMTVFILDMNNFAIINDLMRKFFTEPYPARAVVEVSRLPKDALFEVDAVAYEYASG